MSYLTLSLDQCLLLGGKRISARAPSVRVTKGMGKLDIAYFLVIWPVTRGCTQKFPDWPPRARTANGTALCHYVQLYRYFVSQSSEFCRHNPLCCFSTSVYCCKSIFRYRLSAETFGYTPLSVLEGFDNDELRLTLLGFVSHRLVL
jgi:hypothetical protein